MKVWVVRRAHGGLKQPLDDFEPGQVYDVSQTLGTYLIEQGIAIPELRRRDYERRGVRDRRQMPYTYPPPNDDVNA